MCKIGHKILVITTVLIAIVLALMISVWHDLGLSYIVFVTRIFDVMLPVLAVGALIKYLFTCNHGSCCCGDDCCCKDTANDSCSCDIELATSKPAITASKKSVKASGKKAKKKM
jgi:hypothetical protein